jgi:hypothetical protein
LRTALGRRGSPSASRSSRAKVAQGFAAIADRSYYVSASSQWQLLDWTLRLVTSSSSCARSTFRDRAQRAARAGEPEPRDDPPDQPRGIGTEQALLLYIFRNVTTKSLALSFSVGIACHADRRQRARRLHGDPADDRHA